MEGGSGSRSRPRVGSPGSSSAHDSDDSESGKEEHGGSSRRKGADADRSDGLTAEECANVISRLLCTICLLCLAVWVYFRRDTLAALIGGPAPRAGQSALDRPPAVHAPVDVATLRCYAAGNPELAALFCWGGDPSDCDWERLAARMAQQLAQYNSGAGRGEGLPGGCSGAPTALSTAAPAAAPAPAPPLDAAGLACYVRRYPDLLIGYCAGQMELCRWEEVLQHYEQAGRQEGRSVDCGGGFGAPMPASLRSPELWAVEPPVPATAHLPRCQSVWAGKQDLRSLTPPRWCVDADHLGIACESAYVISPDGSLSLCQRDAARGACIASKPVPCASEPPSPPAPPLPPPPPAPPPLAYRLRRIFGSPSPPVPGVRNQSPIAALVPLPTLSARLSAPYGDQNGAAACIDGSRATACVAGAAAGAWLSVQVPPGPLVGSVGVYVFQPWEGIQLAPFELWVGDRFGETRRKCAGPITAEPKIGALWLPCTQPQQGEYVTLRLLGASRRLFASELVVFEPPTPSSAPPSPSTALPPASAQSVVARLNARFRGGGPDAAWSGDPRLALAAAGVLVHMFDGSEDWAGNRPWAMCEAGCRAPLDHMSASIVSAARPLLYSSGGSEGLVLSPTTEILCAFTADVGSGSNVHGGCPDTWEEGQLRPTLRSQPTSTWNEVIVGSLFWERHLPSAVEAVLWHGQEGRARRVHASFLDYYGLTVEQVPLVRYTAKGFSLA